MPLIAFCLCTFENARLLSILKIELLLIAFKIRTIQETYCRRKRVSVVLKYSLNHDPTVFKVAYRKNIRD